MQRASILRMGSISCQVRLCGRYDGWRAGAVAERLGRGLQSLVQRFESAPRLLLSKVPAACVFFTRHAQITTSSVHLREPFHAQDLRFSVPADIHSCGHGGMAGELLGKRKVASVGAQKLGHGRVAQLVHREMCDACLPETACPPPMHRGRLHGPFREAHDGSNRDPANKQR